MTYRTTSKTLLSSLLYDNDTLNYPSAMTQSHTTDTSLNGYVGFDVTLALLSSHPLFLSALWLYKVGLAVVIITGLFGNVMILFLQRKVDGGKPSSMSVFIRALAVSDSAMLLVSGVTWYIVFVFGVVVADIHDVFCKSIYFVVYVTGVTSPWLLVVMTMQRAASMVWPHRVKAVWTAGRGRVTTMTIVILSVLFNCHILYGRAVQPQPSGDGALCLYVSRDYQHFFDQVWPSVDITFSSFLPFVLIFASNLVLVTRVRRSVREAKDSLAQANSDQLRQREHRASTMTATIIGISVAFIVLTSPLGVFYVMQRTGGNVVINDVDEAAAGYLGEAVGNVMWMANNAVNFYLYLLTGSRYRAALADTCLWPVCFRKGSIGGEEITRSTGVVGTAS